MSRMPNRKSVFALAGGHSYKLGAIRICIANNIGAVKRISESAYKVKSQNGNGYDIYSTDLGWVCSCPDHKYRGVKCKHIFAVEISFALHKEVEVASLSTEY
jgi:hypothetical protein